jgi:hypothetical protein
MSEPNFKYNESGQEQFAQAKAAQLSNKSRQIQIDKSSNENIIIIGGPNENIPKVVRN